MVKLWRFGANHDEIPLRALTCDRDECVDQKLRLLDFNEPAAENDSSAVSTQAEVLANLLDLFDWEISDQLVVGLVGPIEHAIGLRPVLCPILPSKSTANQEGANRTDNSRDNDSLDSCTHSSRA